MKWYRRWQMRRQYAKAKKLVKYPNAQAIVGLLTDPSQDEIGRALGIPRETVRDNLRVLRKHGINRLVVNL